MYRNFWYSMATDALDVLDDAERFGVDGLILEFVESDETPSHGWSRIFDDLATYDGIDGFERSGEDREFAERLRVSVNRIIEKAGKRGIEVFLMGPELSYQKDLLRRYPSLVDPSQDLMYEMTAKRLAQMYTALPGLAGIKLYLDEGEVNINDIKSPVPRDERMRRLIRALLDVNIEKDRTLIVSTFTLMPHQMRAITDALRRVPANRHLVVDNYICPGDWGRILLRNPAIGNTGGHREMISFDYCGEIWGQSNIPLSQAGFIRESWEDIRSKGVELFGMAGYVSWRRSGALETPNESSIYAAQRVTKGPLGPSDDILLDWASGEYGENAGPYIASALSRTREIILKSWHDLGFWVQELPKSEPADLAWYNWSLHWESLAIWDPSYRPIEKALFYPTEETVRMVVEEKEQAVGLARESIADVERARPFLTDAVFTELMSYFERELTTCRVLRTYSETFYRTRMWYTGDKSQEDKVKVLVDDLLQLADEIEHEGDKDFWVCTPERLRFIVSQFKDVLSGSEWPEVADIPDYRIDRWNEQLREWGYETQ